MRRSPARSACPSGSPAIGRAATQAEERLPWIKTVAVKEGYGDRAGGTQTPVKARAAIRGLVRDVVKNVERLELWEPPGPIRSRPIS